MAWCTCSFDQNGGTGGETRTLYANYATSGSNYKVSYFATAQSTSTSYRITTVSVPSKANKVFNGYYAGSTRYVNASGGLITGNYYPNLPASLVAQWLDYSVVTVSLNGGTGGTSTFYRRLSDGRCFSDSALTVEIAEISVPTKYGAKFDGALYGGVTVIDERGRFTAAFAAMSISAASFSVTAQWNTNYSTEGQVYDFFGLASDALIPISSDSGDNKKRVCVSNATGTGSSQANAGRYTSDVNQTSGVWRNPSVTYRIVKDCTVALNLGRAYAATGSGASMSISGYMIVSAMVKTQLGEFPTLKVESVANEGANAVNLFAVSIPVQALAHAQNLMSGMSGAVHLQECSVHAKVDPIVCAENMMPCASDVVHGRYLLNAEVIAFMNSEVPSAANGFVETAKPKAGQDSVCESYSFTAQKEIV